jgi:hypothetical protein
MPRKIRQLKADLQKAGAYELESGSSHRKWVHPLLPGKFVPLAYHSDGQDAKDYQEKDVKQFLHDIAQAKRNQS